METTSSKEKELENILNKFSLAIKIQIQKYGLYRYGLDPDDIAQEVRIKIWKLLKSEKNITNQASYIKKIVSSSVIDQIRRLRREDGIYNLAREKQIAEMDSAYRNEIAHYKNLEEMLNRAVNNLIESRRQVVKLYLLNLTIDEIADHLKWSHDKTRNLLYRGLADLKKYLKNTDDHHG